MANWNNSKLGLEMIPDKSHNKIGAFKLYKMFKQHFMFLKSTVFCTQVFRFIHEKVDQNTRVSVSIIKALTKCSNKSRFGKKNIQIIAVNMPMAIKNNYNMLNSEICQFF